MHGLEKTLNYTFKDQALLKSAFTHRRASTKGFGYERLEFLGDRILGMLTAQKLLEMYPHDAEGMIAARYTVLVSTKNLANLARKLNLGQLIILGQGQKDDVRETDSVLADVFESLMGALYLDGGLDVVKKFFEEHFHDQMKALEKPPIHYKTALQEIVQKKGFEPPVYTLVSSEGPDHAPHFVVRVESELFETVEGTGANKKEAEQNAAQKAYQILEKKKNV